MIEFDCGTCGRKIKVKDEYAGKRGKCPQCKAVVEVPAPALVPEADGLPDFDAIAALAAREDEGQAGGDHQALEGRTAETTADAPRPSLLARLKSVKESSKEWSDAKWIAVSLALIFGLALVVGIPSLIIASIGLVPTLSIAFGVPLLIGAAVLFNRRLTLAKERRREAAELEKQQQPLTAAAISAPASPSIAAGMVTAHCTECGKVFPVSAKLKGQTVSCHECGCIVAVPGKHPLEEQAEKEKGFDPTWGIFGPVAKPLLMFVGPVIAPLVVLDVVRRFLADAPEDMRQPPDWWMTLGVYYGIWFVIAAGILMSSAREVTHEIRHKNDWGETVGRSTLHTGQWNFLFDARRPLRIWAMCWFNLPWMVWVAGQIKGWK